MRVGIPKEIKDHEYRVGATPSMVKAIIRAGGDVYIESEAGAGIGYHDAHYREAGAHVCSAESVWQCDLIIKVKEPQPSEIAQMREGQFIYAYFHLAPDRAQTLGLLDKGVVAIAYETITDARGGLPLLAPMSEIAGSISAHVGAQCLHKSLGGSGLLMGGVPGVKPAKVTVVGGGVSGGAALRVALGMGADVTVLDRSLDKLRELDQLYGAQLKTVYSTPESLAECVASADLVIGAVLMPGARAPKLITRALVEEMHTGSAIVDISIDQGGCSETSRATTHTSPTYIDEGVVHYCVTNMPGACAKTATQALTHATWHHALALVTEGRGALMQNPHLAAGVNVAWGRVTHPAVAQALEFEYTDLSAAMQARGYLKTK